MFPVSKPVGGWGIGISSPLEFESIGQDYLCSLILERIKSEERFFKNI